MSENLELPPTGSGSDRAAKARAARSRLALERRADYLRERGWTCTPPLLPGESDAGAAGTPRETFTGGGSGESVAWSTSVWTAGQLDPATVASNRGHLGTEQAKQAEVFSPAPDLGPGELNPAPTLAASGVEHDYLMSHDLRYGDNDPRHCPPNCPVRKAAQ